MSRRICICCGEPMAEQGNALSRHPNVCASCSSLSDGMPTSNLPSLPDSDDKTQADEDAHPVTADPVTTVAHS